MFPLRGIHLREKMRQMARNTLIENSVSRYAVLPFASSFAALLLFAAVSFLMLPSTADAQALYSYRGPRGSITFTSKVPKGRRYKRVRARTPTYSTIHRRAQRSSRPWRAAARSSHYDPLIKQLAIAHKLEPALVKAVIHVESAFRHDARSPKGAQGLMQLIPATAKRFGVKDSYSPAENVLGGVRYLKWLFKHFKGNLTHVLAGYNAGEGAVKRYNGIPPYRETQEYVRRVLALKDLYRCNFSGEDPGSKCSSA